MMIQNLDTDPNAFQRRYAWGAAVTRDADGRCVYTGDGNSSYMGSCSNPRVVPVGNVIVLIARTDDPNLANANIWHADVLLNEQDGDTYIKASKVTETGGPHELDISQCTTGVTILGSALYTPDDWDKILDLYTSGVLQYPWIAGESLPLRGGTRS